VNAGIAQDTTDAVMTPWYKHQNFSALAACVSIIPTYNRPTLGVLKNEQLRRSLIISLLDWRCAIWLRLWLGLGLSVTGNNSGTRGHVSKLYINYCYHITWRKRKQASKAFVYEK